MITKGFVAGTPGGHYISLNDSEAEKALNQYGKRVKCTVHGNTIHCAIQRNKRLGFYLSAGKATRKKLGIEVGQELVLKIEHDTSEFQMDMPAALDEVLNSDEQGLISFQQLTPGKQRSIMHFVGKAKHIDTQINRALKVVDNLKMGKTDLNELIR